MYYRRWCGDLQYRELGLTGLAGDEYSSPSDENPTLSSSLTYCVREKREGCLWALWWTGRERGRREEGERERDRLPHSASITDIYCETGERGDDWLWQFVLERGRGRKEERTTEWQRQRVYNKRINTPWPSNPRFPINRADLHTHTTHTGNPA